VVYRYMEINLVENESHTTMELPVNF